MTNSARVLIDFIVIAADKALVTEKVDVLILDAGDVLLGLDVLQAIGLVPAGREDVEGDLATDGEAAIHWSQLIHPLLLLSHRLFLKHLRETIIGELLLQGLHHVPPNVVHLVIANEMRQSEILVAAQ